MKVMSKCLLSRHPDILIPIKIAIEKKLSVQLDRCIKSNNQSVLDHFDDKHFRTFQI